MCKPCPLALAPITPKRWRRRDDYHVAGAGWPMPLQQRLCSTSTIAARQCKATNLPWMLCRKRFSSQMTWV